MAWYDNPVRRVGRRAARRVVRNARDDWNGAERLAGAAGRAILRGARGSALAGGFRDDGFNRPQSPEDNRPTMRPRDVGRAVQMGRKEILNTQRWLRGKGYNIEVDGILGKQTRSAMRDWNMNDGKRNPRQWTSRFAPYDDGRQGEESSVQGNNQRAFNSATGRNAKVSRDDVQISATQKKGKKPAKVTSRVGGGRSDYISDAVPDDGESFLDRNVIDPETYANAMTEMQYGPIVAQIERQQRKTEAQNAHNIDQLGKWFSTLGENTAKFTTGGSMLPNFFGSIAGLQQVQGQEQMTMEAGRGRERLTELADALADTTREKSFASVKNRGDAEMLAQDQRKGNVDMWSNIAQTKAGIWDMMDKSKLAWGQYGLAASMAPLEQAGALEDIRGSQSQRRLIEAQIMGLLNPEADPTAANQARDDRRADRSLNAQLRADRRRQAALDREDFNKMASGIAQTIRVPGGRWRLPLKQTVSRLNENMLGYGVDPKSARGKRMLRLIAANTGLRLNAKGQVVGRVDYKGGKGR
jgi:peptidoglycan hydrolase-like protein with peptidoglycan-binding domain